MRNFLIAIFLIISALPVFGQSLHAKRAFDEATVAANTGEFEKALKGYRSALILNEEGSAEVTEKIRYNLGVCLYRTGQLKASVTELNKAIRLSGRNLERSFYALGMAESALENWPAAREAFQKALSIRPNNGEAWFDLAFVYLALRDHTAAAAAFRKSIDHRSVDAALGHNNLGVIMAMNFEFDKAEVEFQNALKLSNGRLAAARRNIEFCRSISNGRLVASTDWSLGKRSRAI